MTYELNQNHYRAKIVECIEAGGDAAEKFERLDDLITHNLSYRVFEAIKEAKAHLSTVESTVLDVPELDIALPFNREMFRRVLLPVVDELNCVIDEVLLAAGLNTPDIDVVIRTGGSSLIACVHELLESRFEGRVTSHDPFTSVAAGLAIANFYGHEFVSDEE